MAQRTYAGGIGRDLSPIRYVKDRIPNPLQRINRLISGLDKQSIAYAEQRQNTKGRQQPKCSPNIEVFESNSEIAPVALDKDRGNEKTAQYKENIYADESAHRPREMCIKRHDRQDGNTAQSVEGRLVFEFRRRQRFHFYSA